MANIWTGDARIISVYNMDTDGLTVDAKATNTLTNSATVGVDGVNFQQGDQSASFAETASQGLFITDANQPANWPLNDGLSTALDQFTIAMWMRFDSQPGVTNRRLIHKVGGLTLFHRTTDAITIFTDASHELFTPSLSTWYHFGLHYNGVEKTFVMQVWDDTAEVETVYGVSWTTNIANAANNFSIGGGTDGTPAIDGQMDEVVICDGLLETIDVTKIRLGTFGTPDAATPRFPMMQIGSGLNASVPRIF